MRGRVRQTKEKNSQTILTEIPPIYYLSSSAQLNSKNIKHGKFWGKILATSTGSRSSGSSSSSSSSTTPKGAGKRRRKTKRKKRKTKRRRRRRTRRKRARHRIKKEERNTHPAVMDEDKVIVDNKFLEKVVADIKKGEKTLKKRKTKSKRKRKRR